MVMKNGGWESMAINEKKSGTIRPTAGVSHGGMMVVGDQEAMAPEIV